MFLRKFVPMCRMRPILCSKYSSQSVDNDSSKVSGFAKAFEKFEQQSTIKNQEKPKETFASLLRNSKFVDLGDPEGKVVKGTIFHIVEDDLYIDFGWKFHCVCPRPKQQAEKYVRGAQVRLLVKDLELSTLFLGYEKDLSLFEAECHLLGLIVRNEKSTSKE